MVAVQLICARIGLVSGKGIAGVLRGRYPGWVMYSTVATLVVANTINAGVDIAAIAAGINLLIPISPSFLIIPIGIAILVLQIAGSYQQIARVFKWLTLALVAYVGAAFFARPDWSAVVRGTFIPTVRADSDFLMAMVAVLGTTISPYLFFWQASEEVEEEIAAGRTTPDERAGATDDELRGATWDVGVGMAFSNLIAFFVILASAATLHAAGITSIQTSAQAAEALRPLAGERAFLLFALGIIGTGMLAVPVLAGSAAYAVAEAAGWRGSLSLKLERGEGRGFYGVVALATLGGVALCFTPTDPVRELFWSAVVNGVIAVPIMAVMMLLATRESVMGPHVIGKRLRRMGWAATGAMALTVAGLGWSLWS